MPGTQAKRKKPEEDEISTDSENGRKPNGRRGQNGIQGWWISLEEAQNRSVGKEKWYARPNHQGIRVQPTQHVANVPADCPVWLFENGDMYIGQWKEKVPKGHPVEDGFGISYNNFPNKCKGLVYIGGWKNGTLEGEGESFWLRKSKTWKDNHFPGSCLTKRDENTGRPRGIPFNFRGTYKNGIKSGGAAVVTLKDGMSRQGPWKNGEPVGNWNDHESLTDGSQVGAVARVPRGVAAKQEPMEEKDGMLTDQLVETDTQESKTISGNKRAFDEKQERISKIRDWIIKEVIVDNPDPHAMESYARRLYNEGYQSLEMIQAHLDEEDVQEFTWMARLHRKLFCNYIVYKL